MRGLLSCAIAATMGFILSSKGITPDTWQYWAVMLLAVALSVVYIIP